MSLSLSPSDRWQTLSLWRPTATTINNLTLDCLPLSCPVVLWKMAKKSVSQDSLPSVKSLSSLPYETDPLFRPGVNRGSVGWAWFTCVCVYRCVVLTAHWRLNKGTRMGLLLTSMTWTSCVSSYLACPSVDSGLGSKPILNFTPFSGPLAPFPGG